jgi:hypothetical protein
MSGCFYGVRSPTAMHRFDILSQDGCRTSGWCRAKPLPLSCQPPKSGVAGQDLSLFFFNHSPGKSLPQRIRSPKLHVSAAPHDDAVVAVAIAMSGGPPPLSAVSHQNLRNSTRISSSESVAPMYRASPATRGASASVLPPMWASMISRREKRRVFPLTTSCAAALNVSWGTCYK